jgi:hypothetical protein
VTEQRPDALFDAAAEILGEAAPEWLRRFPERSEAERDLARMRYEERPSDNGLLYARSGRMMSREEVEELQRRLEGVAGRGVSVVRHRQSLPLA